MRTFEPKVPYVLLGETAESLKRYVYLEKTSRPSPLNWRKLAFLRVEEIVHKNDLNLLDENLYGIMNCDINEEVRNATSEDFFKLFQMAQIMLQYLNKFNTILISQHKKQRLALQKAEKSLKNFWKYQQQLGSDFKPMKHKREPEIHHKDVPSDLFKIGNLLREAQPKSTCTECSKVFINKEYLQSHIMRRHKKPDSLNFLELREDILRLREENCQLVDRLNCMKSKKSPVNALHEAHDDVENETLKDLETGHEMNYKLRLKAQECFWRSKVEELEARLVESESLEAKLVSLKDSCEEKFTKEIKDLKMLCEKQEEELKRQNMEMKKLKAETIIMTQNKCICALNNNGNEIFPAKTDNPTQKTAMDSGHSSEGELIQSTRLQAGRCQANRSSMYKAVMTNPNFFDMLRSEIRTVIDNKLSSIGVSKHMGRISRLKYHRISKLLDCERTKSAERVKDFHAIRQGLSKFIDKKMVVQQRMLECNLDDYNPTQSDSSLPHHKSVTFDESVDISKGVCRKLTFGHSEAAKENLKVECSEPLKSGVFSKAGLSDEMLMKGSQNPHCALPTRVIQVGGNNEDKMTVLDVDESKNSRSESESSPPELPKRPSALLQKINKNSVGDTSGKSSNWDSDSDCTGPEEKKVEEYKVVHSSSLSDLENELEKISI